MNISVFWCVNEVALYAMVIMLQPWVQRLISFYILNMWTPHRLHNWQPLVSQFSTYNLFTFVVTFYFIVLSMVQGKWFKSTPSWCLRSSAGVRQLAGAKAKTVSLVDVFVIALRLVWLTEARCPMRGCVMFYWCFLLRYGSTLLTSGPSNILQFRSWLVCRDQDTKEKALHFSGSCLLSHAVITSAQQTKVYRLLQMWVTPVISPKPGGLWKIYIFTPGCLSQTEPLHSFQCKCNLRSEGK